MQATCDFQGHFDSIRYVNNVGTGHNNQDGHQDWFHGSRGMDDMYPEDSAAAAAAASASFSSSSSSSASGSSTLEEPRVALAALVDTPDNSPGAESDLSTSSALQVEFAMGKQKSILSSSFGHDALPQDRTRTQYGTAFRQEMSAAIGQNTGTSRKSVEKSESPSSVGVAGASSGEKTGTGDNPRAPAEVRTVRSGVADAETTAGATTAPPLRSGDGKSRKQSGASSFTQRNPNLAARVQNAMDMGVRHS